MLNFKERLLPTSEKYIYTEPGYYVWCASIFKHENNYYMAYSRWKKEYGFEGWVSHSEVCLAKSESLFGEFRHLKVILPFGKETDWDAHCAHNPTVLKYGDTYYLYHMANRGNGEFWNHRNHQRIAVAYSKDPEGEWKKAQQPVIDISESGVDSLMTSNPTVTQTPDGKVLMVYKAVSNEGEMPKGGSVICAAAIADHPLGPFHKFGKPLMSNPENPWSVEDPFIWYEGDRYYALVKDFQGYFSGGSRGSTALFVSENGQDWEPAEHPLAYERELDFGDGKFPVRNLERAQIYFEDGNAMALICACMLQEGDEDTFSIRIPLKKEPVKRLRPECISCLLKGHLEKFSGENDNDKILRYKQAVMRVMAEASIGESAPVLVKKINRIQRELFGYTQDFTEIKQHYNQVMLEKEPVLEQELRKLEAKQADSLKRAIQYAMTGNYIDFGTQNRVSVEELDRLMNESRENPVDGQAYAALKKDLEKAQRLVYLTDNCGEIVVDKLLIKEIQRQYPNVKVTVIVRGDDILNDATMDDACQVGLTELVEVMGNGSDIAGTCLEALSREAFFAIDAADVILAKGQANFETLRKCGRNVYYLFMCKCEMFAREFKVPQFTGMLINDKNCV